MSYKNGGEILPPNLLKELQQYIQGEIIYIPKPQNQKAAWGSKSGYKAMILHRNQKIFETYLNGDSIDSIAADFYLSEDSIRKIITKMKKNYN